MTATMLSYVTDISIMNQFVDSGVAMRLATRSILSADDIELVRRAMNIAIDNGIQPKVNPTAQERSSNTTVIETIWGFVASKTNMIWEGLCQAWAWLFGGLVDVCSAVSGWFKTGADHARRRVTSTATRSGAIYQHVVTAMKQDSIRRADT